MSGAAKERNWSNLAAVFTAVCALGVSAYTAYLQRQQVRAQAWPVLSWDYESMQSAEDASFSYVVKNGGVGPAIVKAISVMVDGRPVRRWVTVLQEITPPVDGKPRTAWNVGMSDLHGRVISANERVTPMSPHDKDVARLFAAQAKRISVSICYCSVLEDCWLLEGSGDDVNEPRVVATCARPSVPFEN